MRVATFAVNPGGLENRPILWLDCFEPSAPVKKTPGARAPGQTAPGVPRAKGSTLEVYRWTHAQAPAPAQDADYTLPQLDVCSLGIYGLLSGEKHWPDDTGYLDLGRVAIETVQVPQGLCIPKSAITVRRETAQEALSRQLHARTGSSLPTKGCSFRAKFRSIHD